ncbi:hypothetical protein GIB67_034657 [Kingdonia uniflora]|uniref:J domain-containing protein n=1 Tax=Kingdonia uniflora TaxID=39325 RepID=A0A7J7P045_9MAGN|nr:hypothetical protein GIB67_034657 [Kingdonia uniflora]
MAVAVGTMSGGSCSWMKGSRCLKKKNRNTTTTSGVCCASSFGGGDQYYRTLRVQPGASETEVRKAFRQLALQYHPDVCKGSNCGVQFHRINEAYDVVMRTLRGELSNVGIFNQTSNDEEVYDDEGDDEDWTGWEGAWVPDYTSHNSPYIYVD